METKIERCDAVLVSTEKYLDLEMAGLPLDQLGSEAIDQMSAMVKEWAKLLGIEKGDQMGRRRIHAIYPNTYLIGKVEPGGEAPYLLFSSGHPMQGQHRYDWFPGPDGIRYGFLREVVERELKAPDGRVEMNRIQARKLLEAQHRRGLIDDRAFDEQTRALEESESDDDRERDEPRSRSTSQPGGGPRGGFGPTEDDGGRSGPGRSEGD